VRTVCTVVNESQGETTMSSIRKYAAATVLAAGLALSGCNVFRGQSTPGEYVDDVAITAQVKTQLFESKEVEGLDVNVDSTNGRVKLTGWADTPAEARAAGDLAREVKGVKSVDNQLLVKQ
jgi:hyperosmotically inducible protein